MALTLSGLPSDRFTFGGFSPNRSGQRQKFFADFKHTPGTLIFYESPRRLTASLEDMQAVFGERPKGEVVVLVGPAADVPPRAETLDDALRDALAEMSLKDAAKTVSEALGLPRKQVYERALALK